MRTGVATPLYMIMITLSTFQDTTQNSLSNIEFFNKILANYNSEPRQTSLDCFTVKSLHEILDDDTTMKVDILIYQDLIKQRKNEIDFLIETLQGDIPVTDY